MKENNESIIRIAQIIGKWVGGGVEAVVMNYYRQIDKNKIQFDFICDEDSTNIPYDEIETLGGKVILIPPYQKIFKYNKKLKEVLKNGNYKIIHSHINTLSIFPLRVAKKVGIPVRIAHSHSTSNSKEWKKNLIKNVLKPFSKIYSTDYFCCSELAGRYLFGNKIYNEGKVYILNNAIDLDKFSYNEEKRKEKRKELNILDNQIVVGHIGRFVEQKNHNYLIDIFDELHKQNENMILVLVGQGPLQEEIKRKIEKLGLIDSVKILGQRNDVNELYQAFDVFLLPSLYEGLGMVLIEAQTSGCYSVASTEVPKIAKVTDSIDFIDLSNPPKVWATKINEGFKNNKRKNNIKEITLHGYEIKTEAIKLEKKYGEYYEV